jgi:hypothetical protein
VADFGKGERKRLRALAGAVYEAEARATLSDLDAAFRKWRAKEIDSSVLLDEIHHFHQHESRQLWAIYQRMDEGQVVARGLALGFIKEKDIDAPLLSKLAPLVDLFRE